MGETSKHASSKHASSKHKRKEHRLAGPNSRFRLRLPACWIRSLRSVFRLYTPAASDLTALIDKAPPMQGGEYLQLDVLIALWQSTERALEIELSESKLPLQDFLKARNSRWRLVGRVHFNLAENRRDQDYPFAFMATYTSGLSADGVLRHLPLGQAQREYASARDKAKLLQLLASVQKASEARRIS